MTTPPAQPAPQPLDLLSEQTRLQRDMRSSLLELKDASRIEQEVVLTDIDIPFTHLVMLMVKLALASIPAAIIFGLIIGSCYLVFMAAVIGLGLGLGGLR